MIFKPDDDGNCTTRARIYAVLDAADKAIDESLYDREQNLFRDEDAEDVIFDIREQIQDGVEP